MERAILEYLANALWQLPVLAAGAWVLLWLMKPGPQTQYRVWLTVLGLAVVLPAWGIGGGEIVPVPGATFDRVATTRIVQRSSAVVVVDEMAPLPAVSEPVEAATDTPKGMWRLPSRVQRVHLSATAVHWVMGVYASSVLLGLVRVIRAWRGARRLVETSRQVALCSTAEAVLEDFGRSFDVSLPEVRECAEVTSPMVVGAASPVVLLPEGFADHADDEVRAALLHELAHVKRRDYLTNGVCQVAVLPVLWHPVAYGVQQRIRRTREMVCDQMAAREMRSELGYARCLLTMARRMLGGGLAERPEFVGLFSNNVLEERVMRLMETKSVLTARAKLVRLASGATAMATATLIATSFHVVPTMAAATFACDADGCAACDCAGFCGCSRGCAGHLPTQIGEACGCAECSCSGEAGSCRESSSVGKSCRCSNRGCFRGALCHGGRGRIASAAERACDGASFTGWSTCVACYCSRCSACDTAGAWACSCNTGSSRSCGSSR